MWFIILILFSCTGYFAWRNSARGSWFIQAIFEVFMKKQPDGKTRAWETMDLLTLMTRVNKKVAYDFQSNASREFMNMKKQIPCVTSMLTKDVFFTDKWKCVHDKWQISNVWKQWRNFSQQLLKVDGSITQAEDHEIYTVMQYIHWECSKNSTTTRI